MDTGDARSFWAEGQPVHIYRCHDCGEKVSWGDTGTPDGNVYFDAQLCPMCHDDTGDDLTFYGRCKVCGELMPETIIYAERAGYRVSFAPYCSDCAIEQWEYEHSYLFKMRISPRHGYVYLVDSQIGVWKIGRSSVPVKRISKLDVVLPYDLEVSALIETKDMYSLESRLHDMYASKRVKGEWFKLTTEDIEYIKSLEPIPPWRRTVRDLEELEDLSWR